MRNAFFANSLGVGATYSQVFSGNGSGSRIAMTEPFRLPAKKFILSIAEGYNVSAVGFDKDQLYVGNAKGYLQFCQWTASGETVVEVEADETIEYAVFVLRSLAPDNVANASLALTYEDESMFGGGGTLHSYTPGRNLLTNSPEEWMESTCNSGIYSRSGSSRIAPAVNRVTIPVVSSTPMSFHVFDNTGIDGQEWYVGIHQLDKDLTFLNDSGWRKCPYTFTTLEDTAYIRLTVRNNSSFIENTTNMGFAAALSAIGSTLGFMLQYGEPTEFRPAVEDSHLNLFGGGWSFMILARNSLTVSHVRDIISTTWYYKLQASTASPPEKPTTATPSGWTTTEPSYTEGSTNSLYTTEKTTFSDGTFEYSDVSLSSSYEAAKVAYNKSVQALEAATPIETRTYSGLIGSANNAADASFYFAKIHPTDYTVQWRVSLRIQVMVPTSYMQSVIIQFGGYGSTFSSFDAYTIRNANLGMYFVNLYRATSAGISTNHKGHALGIGLRASTNPTTAAQARTIKVELLEAENCTVAFMDSAVKYASIDGTGSTNYYGLTEMSVATAGQNATNNNNTYDRTLYSQNVVAAAAGYTGTHIICGSSAGYINIAAGAQFDMAYPLLYYATAASTTIASGSTANNHYTNIPGVNFTINGTVEQGAAYKQLFLKGTVSENRFTVSPAPFMTTKIPTEEDGYCYIPLGVMSSASAGRFISSDKIYCFKDGAFGPVSTREASAASSLARKKAEVFYSAPSLPYEAGDMWVRTFAEESGDVRKAIYVCIDSREASGDPDEDAWHDEWETDWGLASTDDAAAEELLAQVDAVSEDLAQTKLDLADQIAENTDAIAAAQSGLASAIAASAENTERLAELGQYFSIIDQILELRASGSPLALKLTNSALAFLYNGEAQADINAEGFNFDKGVVRKQLRIGNFLLTSASGRFDVQYSAEED